MAYSKRVLTCYRYTYGDCTEYWDCYQNGSFVFRAHSINTIVLRASELGINWREVL